MIKNKKSHRLTRSFFIVLSSVLLIIQFMSYKSVHAQGEEYSEIIKNNFSIIPLYWLIFIIGGCIGLTLTYVSFKKYQAEKKGKLKDQSND